MNNTDEILKAPNAMDMPDMAYGYDGVYKWRTEQISRDAAKLIQRLTAELEQKTRELEQSIKLPCKVGDKIFSFRWNIKNEKYEVCTSEIKNVRYDSKDGCVMVSDGERFNVWGKRAFPTCAEAEAALSAEGVSE